MERREDKATVTRSINRNCVFAGFLIAYGSSFQFGYNIGVLNQPSKHINNFYNDTYTDRRHGEPLAPMDITVLWSFTTAIMFIPGGIIGAYLGGWFGDALGRRGGILVSHSFIIVGVILSVICVKVRAPELFLLGRMFIGINLGIGNCIAPMYLQEIVQPNLRGAFGTLHQLAVTSGIFIGSVFGLPQILGTEDRWQYLILLELAPVWVSFCLMPCIHESPRYLLLSKKDAIKARRALEFYRRSLDVDDELNEMEAEGRAMENVQQRTIRQMFSKDIRKALIIAGTLQVVQQFSGINAVFFYSGSVFLNAGVSPADVPYAVIGTNALNVAMTVVAVYLMDFVGRRKLLLVPIVGMIAILVFLTVCLNFQESYRFTADISIVCVLLYVVAFAVGLGPIPWMVGSELFRQDARSKAMAFCGIVNLVGTFVIALGFEPVQKVLKHFTFIVFMGFLIFAFLFVFHFVPETKNRTFEEIAQELSGKYTETIEQGSYSGADQPQESVEFQSLDDPEVSSKTVIVQPTDTDDIHPDIS